MPILTWNQVHHLVHAHAWQPLCRGFKQQQFAPAQAVQESLNPVVSPTAVTMHLSQARYDLPDVSDHRQIEWLEYDLAVI